MRNLLKIFIIFFSITLFILKISTVRALDVLYEKSVDDVFKEINKSGEELATYINENIWKSNNQRVFIRDYIIDGETENSKKYMFWSNYYPNSERVMNSTDKRALAQDEYLTINIENLNINISEYQDVRLSFDYLAAIASLIKSNALLIYVIDDNNNEWGPFYLNDYTPVGFYKFKTTESYERGFNIISENLINNNYSTIKSIKIIPNGNLPLFTNSDLTFSDDSRKQGTEFKLSSVALTGYKNSNYKNDDVKMKTVNMNNVKKSIVQRMYDIATFKWIPNKTMHSIYTVSGGLEFRSGTYNENQVYYGPPYSQRNRVFIEKFRNSLENGIYNVPTRLDGTQSFDTFGLDCAGSVSFSVSKYIPLTFMYAPVDFIWDRHKTKLLGNLNINGRSNSSKEVYTNLYDDSLDKINNNTFAQTEKNKIEKIMSQRLRSNDLRVWYYSVTDPNEKVYNVLGYVNSQYIESNENAVTYDGIVSGEPLKLEMDNLEINSGDRINLSFLYLIKKNNELLSEDNIKINFCFLDNTCVTGTNLNISTPVKVNDDYNSSIVSVEYTANKKINKIEIMPYGDNANTGQLFRLVDVKIDVNGNRKYFGSASVLYEYFDIKSNVSNNLVNPNFLEKINGEFSESEKNSMIAKFFSKQKIYGGYKELKPGNIVATHSKEGNTHVGLITGSTHIECLDGTILGLDNNDIPSPSGSCDNHMGINGNKSYYIRTDISSGNVNTSYAKRNNYGGLVDDSDYVVPFIPKSIYTDIKKFSDLQDKNLDFYINAKNTFAEGFAKSYLPIALNDYDGNIIEEEYVKIINGNTISDIRNGIKGTLYSNYPIVCVNFYVKNKDTGEEKLIKEYPDHKGDQGAYTDDEVSVKNKEKIAVNMYSLYYNTPEEIKEEINSVVNETDNYELRISVTAGTEENIEALLLAPKNIKSISVDTLPTKLEYEQNLEGLDLTNGVLNILYNDGTTGKLSMTNDSVTVEGFNNSTLGSKTIKIKYGGEETSFKVQIVKKNVKKIEIKTIPTKTKYVQNVESLDLTGGEITVTYKDDTTSDISLTNKEVNVTGFNNENLGKIVLTVEYRGVSKSFEVEIIQKEVVSIELEKLPLKFYYIRNIEALDLTGGILLITYNDGTQDRMELSNLGVTTTGFSNDEVGPKIVNLNYMGKTATINVEIIETTTKLVKVPDTSKYSKLIFVGIAFILIGIAIILKTKQKIKRD